MNRKRCAALLLAVLLTLPLFAGCSGGTGGKDPAVTGGSDAPITDVPQSDDTTGGTKILDAVPELDFDGAPFRTLEQNTMYSLVLDDNETWL